MLEERQSNLTTFALSSMMCSSLIDLAVAKDELKRNRQVQYLLLVLSVLNLIDSSELAIDSSCRADY